jgi:hypothetical protein
MAKLVILQLGGISVAALASVSALSFPSKSVCPGTQCSVILACLLVSYFAALMALIWQACPGLADGFLSLHNPAWLSE